MAKRVEALVTPEVLTWARVSVRMTVDEAARKVGVKPEAIRAWETGDQRPTIRQMHILSRTYKRSVAAFYLPYPPEDVPPLRDFRRLPGQVAGTESTALRFAIRQAYNRREVALELLQDKAEAFSAIVPHVSMKDDPERQASQLRELLQVTYEQQIKWRTGYEALRGWRSALENLGILVFQALNVGVDEMRGFSIGDEPLPVIAINVKDAPPGRVFSMLHEFAHLVLHIAGICDLEEEWLRPPEAQRVEVFCNRIAGAILVPFDRLLNEKVVQGKYGDPEWSHEELRGLARLYQVSREVILRRLLLAGRTTAEHYQLLREEFQEEYKKLSRPKGGFMTPAREAVTSAGVPFVSLVLNGYYQGSITAADLSEYLGVRLKHLPKIEQAVFGRSITLGV